METLRKATGTASRAIFGNDGSGESTEKAATDHQLESGGHSETERQPEAEKPLEDAREPEFEQHLEPEKSFEAPAESPPESEQPSAPLAPSAPSHEQSDSVRLRDQAATAALYNKPQSQRKQKSITKQPVDEHRLSAAGAGASLRYAKPRELPSYPVVGVSDKLSSAGAAASLANAHHKPVELWKADPSASASAAAVLAKDYKMAELWHPEQSRQGSKAAALAAKEGANVKIWRPGSTEYGHSAAIQAVRAREGLSPQLDYGYTADGRKKSLRASKLAMSSGRRRADSSPALPPAYPDSVNASQNALQAATSAHAPHVPAFEREIADEELPPSLRASRIVNIAGHVPREMFGSHPPLAIGVEEKKRQEALHSAAVAMAKQMYQIQQKTISSAAGGASDTGNSSSTMRTTNLEEAAKKLAAERLAKLHDEHAVNRDYRDYYGTSQPTHRLSIRGKGRRRASSMDQAEDDDEAQSRRIRTEMSIFNKNVAEVDTKKRQKDREALLAAAQRNVRARMHNLDEKVFSETGKVPPSMMQEWEAKARAAAEADSKARMANYGKVNIGGGRFVDQGEVNAVATRNVQPVLDEINDKAELHRAKEEEARLDREQAKRLAQEEKVRGKELKMELKRIKDHEKEEQRARKQAEKARKADEKRRAKEEKRKLKEASKPAAPKVETTTTEPAAEGTAAAVHQDTSESSSLLTSSSSEEEEVDRSEVPAPSVENTEGQSQVPVVVETTAVVTTVTTKETVLSKPDEHEERDVTQPMKVDTKAAATAASGSSAPTTSPPTSPTKNDSRVVSWIKDRFSRRASKSQKPDEPRPKVVEDKDAKVAATGSGGPGGAIASGEHGSSSSVERRDSSIRDVAMAGRASSSRDGGEESHHPGSTAAQPVISSTAADDDDARPSRSRKRSPSPEVSPLSEDLEDDDDGDNGILAKKGKDEERRDRFGEKNDEKGLAPPPATFAHRTSDSPVRDSKFLENL
ncbi:MAG: hypothetical protein M1816_003086 [Peltula sp. TS41687]|nr:MAG: hypothetical protein M1816_003086 [Peltula sp. TS41687]